MNRAELLATAAQIYSATITRDGQADEVLSTRAAARLIREVERRYALQGARADYYDGIIPSELKKKHG